MSVRCSGEHRRSRRWATYALLAALTFPVAAAAGDDVEPIEVAPIVLPQARIDSVDVRAWPSVRVTATILDGRGQPVEVKAINGLEVRDAKSAQTPPLVRFKNGQPLDGRKDGKLWPADKAGIKRSVVLVVVGHQHESLRLGSLGRRIKEAVGGLLKRFAKTDRGQLLWYADRIKGWWGLKGRLSDLSDVEQTRKACADARAEALSGGEITLGADDAKPKPGTDLCGLRDDLKDVNKILESKAFEGYFPRLFNLGLPFHSPARYSCKLPRDALDQFGQLTPENITRRREERDTMRLRGEPVDFETSTLDEAMRLLLRDSRADEQRVLLLVSDGKDGYLKADDLCRQQPPRACADKSSKDLDRCVSRALEDEVKREQVEFRARALHWIGTARAAGVRIFAVGIASLGTRWELDRLRLLAERTGGTYREAPEEQDVAGAVAAMGAEVFDQVVIDFIHPEPDLEAPELAIKLALELEPTMVRGETRLQTRGFEVDLPERVGWRERARGAVVDVLVQLQELLGYRVYVIVGWVVIVMAALLTLLFTFLIVRGFFRLVARLFGKGKA